MDVLIKEVVFLTPAKLTISENGSEKTVVVSVDIINRKVYDSEGKDYLSDLVFSHLDGINVLADDFFAASEDVLSTAIEANSDKDQILEQVKNTI